MSKQFFQESMGEQVDKKETNNSFHTIFCNFFHIYSLYNISFYKKALAQSLVLRACLLQRVYSRQKI